MEDMYNKLASIYTYATGVGEYKTAGFVSSVLAEMQVQKLIDKAWKWIEGNLVPMDERICLDETKSDFIKAMEGEK